MVSSRAKKLIGLAMVLLGLIQTATAVMQDFQFYATLGVFYSFIGAAYVWFEGYGKSL